MSDPSNFITNPPSTFVKVQNVTTREEMNGQLGIAVAWQQDRGRYLVHNVTTQQTIALKPENLVKASQMETMRGQYLQAKNDPRVQQQLRDYYAKAKKALHPVKPEYAAIGVFVLWCVLIYFVGFTKTVMVTSVLLLLAVMVAPDVMEGASLKTILTNMPRRSREAMEETVPMVKGRLSNQVAMGIVIFMIVIAGKSLFAETGSTRAPVPPRPPTAGTTPLPHHASHIQALKEEHYKLGFEDAKNGLDFGTSLPKPAATGESARHPRGMATEDSDYSSMEFDDYTMAPLPPQKKGFGFGTIMSAFFLIRTASELGTDVAAGGGWSFQRMVANARTLEPWKLGMVGFSLFNLVRSFV